MYPPTAPPHNLETAAYVGLSVEHYLAVARANNADTNGVGPVPTGKCKLGATKPPHKIPYLRKTLGFDADWDDYIAARDRLLGTVLQQANLHPGSILNIAGRLPRGVVGIDVDAYGDKRGAVTLAEWEAELGPLPPTYLLTARGYGASGIRLYAVDLDFCSTGNLHTLAGQLGDVEVIDYGHRFVMLPGAQHPTGTRYVLYAPTGRPAQTVALPGREALPVLPAAVQAAMRGSGRGQGGVYRTREDLRAEAALWADDKSPGELTKTVEGVHLAPHVGDRSVRNAAHRALCIAARKARAGCYPWDRALREIEHAAVQAYAWYGNGKGLDFIEFERSVDEAIRCALDTVTIENWGPK